MSRLEVVDVTVSFDAHVVLDQASLDVSDGEIVALLGPSGSGKSTLLRVITGISPVDGGTVRLDGRDITHVPTHRRGIGLVFQDEQLFPHRDVAANVGFGLEMTGVPRPEQQRRVAAVLELVGLSGFERRRVTELSGGEAKRVALARSLAPAPRALLLDEPLTGLDRELHDRLAVDLARVLRSSATTALVVTHDRDEAATVADRVVMMDAINGARSIVELATADTRPLRQAVLRNDTPSRDVVLDGDDEPTTVHLGVVDPAGRVVAISTWLRRALPGAPAGSCAVQLRAMAIDPRLQRTGIGRRLVEAGLERAAADGADLVWANARDTALGFYLGSGFEVVGDGFVDETTALPHHRIVRRL